DRTATWRSVGAGSAARAASSASTAESPDSNASRHRGPYAGSPNACVATAPTPARAQGTTVPTANIHVCTATPSAPVTGSRATIEYVIRHLRGTRTPLKVDAPEQRTMAPLCVRVARLEEH